MAFVNITFINAFTGNYMERFFYGYPAYSLVLNSRFFQGYTNDGAVTAAGQTFVKNSTFTQSGWFPSPNGQFFGIGGYVRLFGRPIIEANHRLRYGWNWLFALNSNFSYYWGQLSVDYNSNIVVRGCSIVRDLRDQVINKKDDKNYIYIF